MNTEPPIICWWCEEDPSSDHPLADHYAMCSKCETKPIAVMATAAMNRAHKNYINTKVDSFRWRKWDRANQGDWSNEIEAAP